MNILMVNGTHPDTPHISGVRAGRFADELARLGHRCVLICPPVEGQTPRHTGPMGKHDWSKPYVAEVDDPAVPEQGRLRTAWSLFRDGGRRAGFRGNVIARGREIARDLRPDIGWSTFGTLEGVVALRHLAREIGFPWLFDVKDNADLYIPKAMHRPLAWRLKGFGAVQANSRLHADAADRWLGQSAEVVHSGVDPCFFADQSDPHDRYVTLVGSLYRRDVVDAFVKAVAAHNSTTSTPLRIVHLGTQGAWIAESGAAHGVETEAPGYVLPAEMARICQGAMANGYIFLGRTFHHKLFELLACRRPVIAFGGELAESIAAAADLHAPLYAPVSPEQVATMLAEIDSPGYAINSALPAQFYTWPQQAAMVDAAMRRLVE